MVRVWRCWLRWNPGPSKSKFGFGGFGWAPGSRLGAWTTGWLLLEFFLGETTQHLGMMYISLFGNFEMIYCISMFEVMDLPLFALCYCSMHCCIWVFHVLAMCLETCRHESKQAFCETCWGSIWPTCQGGEGVGSDRGQIEIFLAGGSGTLRRPRQPWAVVFLCFSGKLPAGWVSLHYRGQELLRETSDLAEAGYSCDLDIGLASKDHKTIRKKNVLYHNINQYHSMSISYNICIKDYKSKTSGYI